MPINIKINNFEGPFDLLLHLIKKNEMDIYNIQIYEITNQYLEAVEQIKEMDLEVTSEFIVIAATLLEIKSRMLLPKQKIDESAADLEDDPRKELIDKLLEYKKFKIIAGILRERELYVGSNYSKKPEIIDDSDIDKAANTDILKGLSMLDLYNVYNDLINKFINRTNSDNRLMKQIPIDAFKIEDKMIEIKNRFQGEIRLKFSQIINESIAKMETIVTFLALLELIKQKEIKVLQESNFMEIYIERVSQDEGD